jgi:cytochrome c oxidase cbb3-type subunit 4
MNSGTLQGIATLLTMISFLGICVWAYSGKRKAQFKEAANLPFADDGDIDITVANGANNEVKNSLESQKP